MFQTKQQRSLSVLSLPLPSSIDRCFVYFLHSHHLTAFLALTLLILGIASLLASDVVLLPWTQTSLKAFIFELLVFFCFVFFFFCHLIHSQPFGAGTVKLQSSDMLVVEASKIDRLPFGITLFLNKISNITVKFQFSDQITVTLKAIFS